MSNSENSLSPRQQVYNVFIDYFGEDKVDLQDNYIIVHFPLVSVTNEYDKSVLIEDLYARTKVSISGTIIGSFELIRATVSETQYSCGYLHSHVQRKYRFDNWKEWNVPCLGSGPIRGTIATLSTVFSLDTWTLYCLELDKYVRTESVSGVPYFKLETIGINNSYKVLPISADSYTLDNAVDSIYNGSTEEKFIWYLLRKRPFKFNFINGCYGIAMSDSDIIITVSNLFIEWYNALEDTVKIPMDGLLSRQTLIKGKKSGNSLYRNGNSSNGNMTSYEENTVILHFKGSPVIFKVYKNPGQDTNEAIFLNIDYISKIVANILILINSHYGQQNNSSSSGETYRYV